jgi:hypothetical protein
VLKGLQVASNVFGIKSSVQQGRVAELREQQLGQQVAQGELKTQEMERQAELQEAGIQTPEQFSKQYFQVPGNDAEAFKKKFGDIPLVSVQVGTGTDAPEILGVDKETFKAFKSEQRKAAEGAKAPEVPKVVADVDKAFSKKFTNWVSEGEEAKSSNKLRQLENTIRMAEKKLGSGFASRAAGGLLPDVARALVTPEQKAVEDDLKSIAQESLKQILGGQFGEKEGKQLLDRAFDPAQTKEENIRRMWRLHAALKANFQAKKSSMDYFAEHNTLQGFKQPDLPAISGTMFTEERGGSISLPGEAQAFGQRSADDVFSDFLREKQQPRR